MEAEVLAINNDARNLSLQIALLVPLLAGLLGLGNSFRMLRLPDQKPSVRSGRDGLRLTLTRGRPLNPPGVALTSFCETLPGRDSGRDTHLVRSSARGREITR